MEKKGGKRGLALTIRQSRPRFLDRSHVGNDRTLVTVQKPRRNCRREGETPKSQNLVTGGFLSYLDCAVHEE